MTYATTTPVKLGQIIDGEEKHSARLAEVYNPGAKKLIGTVADGTEADAEAAVTAAAGAQSAWATTTVDKRAHLLRRIAEEIDAQAGWLAKLVALENGSTLPTVQREVAAAATVFRQFAAELSTLLAPDASAGPNGEFVRIERKPFGVVVCIVPWNAPLILTANKIAPAIAAGNTVVLKPSPFAPLGVTTLGRLVATFLPAGVINIVNGDADVAGTLITHRRVRKISFTGGGATARIIMRQAAQSLTPVHFELGGNDPAIVLDDADLPTTVNRIADSAFRRAGQVCFAVKRVYVPNETATEFKRLLIERVDQTIVGDALDVRATMGPVNNAGQFARVHGLVERTIAMGRDVRVLGTRLDPKTWDDGYFLQPTLVLDAKQDDEIVKEEQFGPILPVVTYDSEEQAIQFANDTPYGLCGSIWSRSQQHALDMASRIEAGVTYINNHILSPTGTQNIPFGGWKQSGIGWEGSSRGIDEYLQFHSVDIHSLPTGKDA